ncbi:Histone H4 transcription factor [Eumeta japonica]|uniref:Histone H4 transcription factor n=1 Tax=Eumeta variegata TaxID=151549 RepID=A0A4C1U696_EUMVA|nr:Histone H4 transcription factor [Eumeta japonica]
MTAPTRSALASHIRYRHLGHDRNLRTHQCPHCEYRAITKQDLKKHIMIHTKKRKAKRSTDEELSDEECSSLVKKKKKIVKKYCCHMCPKNKMKIFLRGSRLTAHLVNVHGAQRSCSRFKYQICDDGMYRLNITRYESLEVSKKVTYGDRGPIESLNKNYDVEVVVKSEPTEFTPMQFTVKLKEAGSNEKEEEEEEQVDTLKEDPDEEEETNIIESIKKEEINSQSGEVEITMCDVDEKGNVIHSTVVTSDVQYM